MEKDFGKNSGESPGETFGESSREGFVNFIDLFQDSAEINELL
jgi:hypothetical protein